MLRPQGESLWGWWHGAGIHNSMGGIGPGAGNADSPHPASGHRLCSFQQRWDRPVWAPPCTEPHSLTSGPPHQPSAHHLVVQRVRGCPPPVRLGCSQPSFTFPMQLKHLLGGGFGLSPPKTHPLEVGGRRLPF